MHPVTQYRQTLPALQGPLRSYDAISSIYFAIKHICVLVWLSRYGIPIKWGCPFGSGPILLNNVTCSGEESSLAECQHNPWGSTSWCNHYYDTACRCCQNPGHCGYSTQCEGSCFDDKTVHSASMFKASTHINKMQM